MFDAVCGHTVARKENVFAVAVKVADADADDADAALLRQHSLP